MQNSELFERKKQESIKLKNLAKNFAEKLARKKAEEVFTERVQPTTMFTETKKRQFIEKITKQYEPIFYKDIINKIISQKVMEEQNKRLYNFSKNKSVTAKNVDYNKYSESLERKQVNSNKNTKEDQDEDIAQAIIDSSREVFNLLNKETDNEDIPNNILQDNDSSNEEERLVMSILKK